MDYQRYQYVPNNLRQYRKERGLKQDQVAAALRLKNKTLISRWESGKALPNLVNVFRMAKIYNTSIEQLFTVLSELTLE